MRQQQDNDDSDNNGKANENDYGKNDLSMIVNFW